MASTAGRPRQLGWWLGWVVLLTLLFAQPLFRLLVYASGTDLHSHIPLVPAIAGYLLYIDQRWRTLTGRRSLVAAALAGAVALGALAAVVLWRGTLSLNDDLALTTLAYLSLVVAGGFLFLGPASVRAAAFPLGFLIFTIPLPDGAVHWLEMASTRASAEVSALLFNIAGTPLVRNGPVFELPGIVLEVARECSGIRSSWALFITSVLAAHMFLRSPWRRIALVAFVIPLGIVRNAFRILVIGLLCVHVGPHMIDSLIHRRGGPFFFVLSLVPLFLLLWWLRRRERAA
jgi:exosortase C (VPDSG-CTERM-specific)